jgi:hypothetical protein
MDTAIVLLAALLTVDEVDQYRALPSAAYCKQQLEQVKAFLEYIEGSRLDWVDEETGLPTRLGRIDYAPAHQWDGLRAAATEGRQLLEFWDMAYKARTCGEYWAWDAKSQQSNGPFIHLYMRREARERCRELIGQRAFCLGEWPPALPWWRLPRHEP